MNKNKILNKSKLSGTKVDIYIRPDFGYGRVIVIMPKKKDSWQR